MLNFSPLESEIVSVAWGTPANFNGFCLLGFITAWMLLSGGQPNFAQCLAVSWAGTLYIHFPGLLPRVAITLGIGPHSSFDIFLFLHQPVQELRYRNHRSIQHVMKIVLWDQHECRIDASITHMDPSSHISLKRPWLYPYVKTTALPEQKSSTDLYTVMTVDTVSWAPSLSSLAPACDEVKVLEQLVFLVADVASFPRRRQTRLLHREFLVKVAHVFRMTLCTTARKWIHTTTIIHGFSTSVLRVG